MKRAIRLAAIVAAAPVLAAGNGDFLQTAFGADVPDKGVACFARAYDARHLAANKAQRIGDVAIHLAVRARDGVRYVEWDLATHFRGAGQIYWSNGECDRFSGLKAQCHVEGDGGAMTLTLSPDGTTLTARFDALNVWRPQDAADETQMQIDRSAADKVARLDRAPMSACRQARG